MLQKHLQKQTFKYLIIHLQIMGTITANVEDDVERYFRRRVQEQYGQKKGALGKALTEAMEGWAQKSCSLNRCMELLEKGVDMGKFKFNRDEIHERD